MAIERSLSEESFESPCLGHGADSCISKCDYRQLWLSMEDTFFDLMKIFICFCEHVWNDHFNLACKKATLTERDLTNSWHLNTSQSCWEMKVHRLHALIFSPTFTARRSHCDDRSQALQWGSGDSELYSRVSGCRMVTTPDLLLCPLRTFASISSSPTCLYYEQTRSPEQRRRRLMLRMLVDGGTRVSTAGFSCQTRQSSL